MKTEKDRIVIRGLRLDTRVGVPDEERAVAQTVAVDVEIVPESALSGLGDEIGRTVDYFEVAEALKRVAAVGERRLIETLAEELGQATLAFAGVTAVTVEVRKFILPETDWVAVRVSLP
ncbi:MAG: dihydroneopterin aldolase [Verrucomicrobiales bacterium]|nr:dihydroneopterin aldolase [Verrucomicrobiales bacterium]